MLHRQLNEGDQDVLHRNFQKYGPSARNLFRLYTGVLTTAELDYAIERALHSIDTDKLAALVEMAGGGVLSYGPPNISHSVILVYPDPTRRIMLADVISRHVSQLLADRLLLKGWEELVKTYRLFHDIYPLSSAAGWMFEYYCHRMLSEQENRQISLTPLMDVKNSKRQTGLFKLCRRDRIKSQPLTTLTITKRQRHHFQNGDDLELSQEKYFIPTLTSNPAYDGFMIVDQSLVAFQMTTKESHDAKTPGILDLERYANGMQLMFVLLVCEEREDDEIILAVPAEVYEKAKFFISIVEVRT